MVLISCKNEPILTHSSVFFTESELAICELETCPSITIEYPLFKETNAASQVFNSGIKRKILYGLYLGENTPDTTATIAEAAKEFVIASRDHKTEFDLDLDYEADVSIFEIYRDEQLICFEENFYQYTGGAHGMSATFFLVAEIGTGNIISAQDLFADYEGFSKVAEKEFRRQRGLSLDVPLDETEYWFEEGEFYLPYSPGINETGFQFIYQPYDIAPYSEGFVEFTVSWDLAQPYLSKTYFE